MKLASLVLVVIVLLLSRSAFAAEAPVYELKSRDLDRSENVTIEAWVKPDAGASQGARIIDKWGPGSQLGYRVQMGEGGKVEFISTMPEPLRSSSALPTDRLTQ